MKRKDDGFLAQRTTIVPQFPKDAYVWEGHSGCIFISFAEEQAFVGGSAGPHLFRSLNWPQFHRWISNFRGVMEQEE